jgi:hypothetical protein
LQQRDLDTKDTQEQREGEYTGTKRRTARLIGSAEAGLLCREGHRIYSSTGNSDDGGNASIREGCLISRVVPTWWMFLFIVWWSAEDG